MTEPTDLEPALPVRTPRRLWSRVVAVVMALAILVIPFWEFPLGGFDGVVDTGCPSPFVLDRGVCLLPDRLIVMTNGDQDRTDVAAAIAPYSGTILTEISRAGIYEVRFPVASVADLAPIMRALESAGFSVARDVMLELYGKA